MPKAKPKSKRRILKGWGEIAEFQGQTVSVDHRWQKSGTLVTREGRFVYASPEELTTWVGTERGGSAEPTLSWNQLHSLTRVASFKVGIPTGIVGVIA